METKNLQKQIMRRVYYAFGIRLATHPVTVHTLVLAIAGYALAVLVHVERVLQNIAATPVADLGSKVVTILLQADTLSLLALGLAMFTALSLPLRLPKSRSVVTWRTA